MIRRLLLWVTVLALAGTGLGLSAGAASASVVIRPETISAGTAHTCALDSAGKAWCWGLNVLGRLGDGADFDENTGWVSEYAPVRVAGGRTFVTIGAGDDHTCALDRSGAAWCWGSDEFGQLGDGDAGGGSWSAVPVRVAGGHTFRSITVGNIHTCALGRAGQAWCWGNDSWGQIGDGAPAPWPGQLSPVRVAGTRSYTAITAGGYHTCALAVTGKAWCWGSDAAGQVGDGSGAEGTKATPVRVAGGIVFRSISAGLEHTCALGRTGRAWCWGSNTAGQLGNRAMGGPASSPVRVVGGLRFRTVSAGGGHTCALGMAGRAWCWGADDAGQLGNGRAGQRAQSPTPRRVSGHRTFATIAAGAGHSCAVSTSGSAWCWGSDAGGQVGDGAASQADKHSPVRVAGKVVWRQPRW